MTKTGRPFFQHIPGPSPGIPSSGLRNLPAQPPLPQGDFEELQVWNPPLWLEGGFSIIWEEGQR